MISPPRIPWTRVKAAKRLVPSFQRPGACVRIHRFTAGDVIAGASIATPVRSGRGEQAESRPWSFALLSLDLDAGWLGNHEQLWDLQLPGDCGQFQAQAQLQKGVQF